MLTQILARSFPIMVHRTRRLTLVNAPTVSAIFSRPCRILTRRGAALHLTVLRLPTAGVAHLMSGVQS